MSKMKDILIDIETMLREGVTPALVAARLDVPLSWVIECEEQMFYDDSSYGEQYAEH